GGEVRGALAGDRAGGRGPHGALPRPLPVRDRRGRSEGSVVVPARLRDVRPALEGAHARDEREDPIDELHPPVRRGAPRRARLGPGQRPMTLLERSSPCPPLTSAVASVSRSPSSACCYPHWRRRT